MVKVSQEELILGAIAGKIISFPTDTVPALAISPELASRIFQLKQRPKHKPLILMGASIADLLPYVAYTLSELTAWQPLIDKHLPGAITLVLPASTKVTDAINPTDFNTVGIRVPDHSIACQILQKTGVLATTSANISGQDALTSMEAIDRVFPNILVLEDADPDENDKTSSGLPSTVVSWTDQGWKVLRQGIITIV